MKRVLCQHCKQRKLETEFSVVIGALDIYCIACRVLEMDGVELGVKPKPKPAPPKPKPETKPKRVRLTPEERKQRAKESHARWAERLGAKKVKALKQIYYAQNKEKYKARNKANRKPLTQEQKDNQNAWKKRKRFEKPIRTCQSCKKRKVKEEFSLVNETTWSLTCDACADKVPSANALSVRKWRLKNKKYFNDRNKAVRADHAEERKLVTEMEKKRKLSNRECQLTWLANNPEYHKLYQRKRKAKKENS